MSTNIILPPADVLSSSAAELAEAAQAAGDLARLHAVNKAELQLLHGATITPTSNGFLLPSGTRGGIVHRVHNVSGCDCEAGRSGRTCWHALALEIVERTQCRAIPAAPRTARSAYELALAELNELYL